MSQRTRRCDVIAERLNAYGKNLRDIFFNEIRRIAVSERESCEDAAKSPVCDADGEEHVNLCHLLRTGKVLAYTGPCLVRNARRLVDVRNGIDFTGVLCVRRSAVTQRDRCAAWTATHTRRSAWPFPNR